MKKKKAIYDLDEEVIVDGKATGYIRAITFLSKVKWPPLVPNVEAGCPVYFVEHSTYGIPTVKWFAEKNLSKKEKKGSVVENE